MIILGKKMKYLLALLTLLMVLSLFGILVQAKNLTIYYGMGADHFAPVIAAFEKATGIEVDEFRAPTEEMLTVVELEFMAGKPKADIIIAAEPQMVSLQNKYDAFAEYTPKYQDKLLSSMQVYAPLYTPLGMQLYILAYNSNIISAEEAPKKWADLLDPKWKNKIAMADPKSSASVHGAIWFVAQHLYEEYGEPYGWKYFEELAKLNPTLTAGHGPIRDLIATGERPLGIQLISSEIPQYNAGEPVRWNVPEEGTPVETQLAAMVKGTSNIEEAQAFLDFIVSVDGQTLMWEIAVLIPARDDVSYEFPDGTKAGDYTLVPIIAEEVDRELNMQKMQEAMDKVKY